LGSLFYLLSLPMDTNTLSLSFPFAARYFKLGSINERTKEVWFVLHGQGQLAEFFIQKFKKLEDENICVIAPEGLSRYYLEGYSGRVGATWMTKENRLMDIDNYIQYLNAVYKTEVNMPLDRIKITVFGFSQGAATASRWVMNQSIDFHRLILWGGVFPPDIDFTKGHEILKTKETYIVYGKSDPFLSDDRFLEMESIFAQLNIHPKIVTFSGSHEIHNDTLMSFCTT
jgi:predicted esterase